MRALNSCTDTEHAHIHKAVLWYSRSNQKREEVQFLKKTKNLNSAEDQNWSAVPMKWLA